MFEHGIDEATAYAKEALRILHKHGVPPTPANFEIFYTYACSADLNLVKTMNIIMGSDEGLSEARLAEIHATFSSRNEDAARMAEIADRMEATLEKVSKDIADTGEHADAVGERLRSVAETGVGLDEAVREIVREARELAERGRKVGERLEQSRRTVETLRSDLAAMRDAAETDALTDLPNRRVLERAMRDAAATSMEVDTPMVVAMFDIDHFKAFNDTYGHLVGDQVLRCVAKILRERTRQSDVVARYGGEEFAVVFPETSSEEAFAVLDRIRETLSTRQLTDRRNGHNFGRITISAGMTTYVPGESMDALTRRADRALYEAKSAGRDRVAVIDSTEDSTPELT